MPPRPYLDYVRIRAQSSPCINGLDRYLQRKAVRASKIVYMDYSDSKPCPEHLESIELKEDELVKLMGPNLTATTRIFLVEDISPQLMSLLGSALDIDPIFFADYVNTSFENFETSPPPPSLAISPALLSERGYLHLHYQQVLDLGNAGSFGDVGYALKTDTNITRNIRRLAPLSGKQLALARVACSMLVKKLNKASVYLILVDHPVRSVVHGLGTHNQKSYPSKPLHGGFEDFATSGFSPRSSHGQGMWSRDSVLDSLVHYLQHQRVPGIFATPTSVLSLAYYPTRIALAQWNSYTHLISRYSKHYEYSLHDITSRLHGDDIIELQRWRRRIRQSRHKLTLLAEFVRFWMPQDNDQIHPQKTWNMVLSDIDYLQRQLQDYSQSLEQMVTVATSMMQLLDSRRSILEAINVRRLTYIALVFAPLAWVASLFSMSETYSPGHERFWVYFATAIPLLCLVGLLSTLQYDHVGQKLVQYWQIIFHFYPSRFARATEHLEEV